VEVGRTASLKERLVDALALVSIFADGAWACADYLEEQEAEQESQTGSPNRIREGHRARAEFKKALQANHHEA
jgi:hypothetical protein